MTKQYPNLPPTPPTPPTPLRFAVEVNNFGVRLDYTKEDLLSYADVVAASLLQKQEQRHLEELKAYELTVSNLRAKVALQELAVNNAKIWLTKGIE